MSGVLDEITMAEVYPRLGQLVPGLRCAVEIAEAVADDVSVEVTGTPDEVRRHLMTAFATVMRDQIAQIEAAVRGLN